MLQMQSDVQLSLEKAHTRQLHELCEGKSWSSNADPDHDSVALTLTLTLTGLIFFVLDQ